MTDRRHFEDYNHGNSRMWILLLQKIAGQPLDMRDRDFVTNTLKRNCFYDYELSDGQKFVIQKIASKYRMQL